MTKVISIAFALIGIFLIFFTFAGMGVDSEEVIDNYTTNISNNVSKPLSYTTPASYENAVSTAYGEIGDLVNKGADGTTKLKMMFPFHKNQLWYVSEYYAADRGSYDHPALDIATHSKSIPIYAAFDCTVVAYPNDPSGFGNYTPNVISSDGKVKAYYGHCINPKSINGFSQIPVGTKVKKGDILAYSGNEGGSTGTHLHFELYTDDPDLQASMNAKALQGKSRITFDPLSDKITYDMSKDEIKGHK